MSKKKAQKSSNSRVSPEEFVTTWQSCESAAEAKEKLGIGASGRAARYRKAGVDLKMFPRSGRRIDVKALNALLK